jgi:hypothetical protein
MIETLVQGPGSNEIEQSHWMRAINWTHWTLDESPRPKKSQVERLKPTWHHIGGKIDLLKPLKK